MKIMSRTEKDIWRKELKPKNNQDINKEDTYKKL